MKKVVINLFGLVDSGKTTVAHELNSMLWGSILIDAHDFRRKTGNADYTEAGRRRNMAALEHAANSMDAKVVITAFNMPSSEIRKCLLFSDALAKFVFCDCPIGQCVSRDTKGLYAKSKTDPSIILPGIHPSMPFDSDGCDLVVSTRDSVMLTPEGMSRKAASEICIALQWWLSELTKT